MVEEKAGEKGGKVEVDAARVAAAVRAPEKERAVAAAAEGLDMEEQAARWSTHAKGVLYQRCIRHCCLDGTGRICQERSGLASRTPRS